MQHNINTPVSAADFGITLVHNQSLASLRTLLTITPQTTALRCVAPGMKSSLDLRRTTTAANATNEETIGITTPCEEKK